MSVEYKTHDGIAFYHYDDCGRLSEPIEMPMYEVIAGIPDDWTYWVKDHLDLCPTCTEKKREAEGRML